MWDCKHRRSADDFCNRRKTKCFPGGVGCVLKGKYEFPFREEEDPLLKTGRLKKHGRNEGLKKRK
jgi:hypothetical protein